MGHGVLQAVSDFDILRDPGRFDEEMAVLEAMARAADGHPLSLSLLQRDQAPDQWRDILRRVAAADRAGTPMRVQVAARPIGVLLGLEATLHPFMGFPGYKEVADRPLPERVAHLRRPEVKAKILQETSEPVAGDGSPLPPLADQLLANLDFVSMRLFPVGETPDYEPPKEASLFGRALAHGVTPLEAIYDALLEDGGHELLYFPLFNYAEHSLDALREMLTHPLALGGLSDGGAHVGTICDASFPTTMLTHWVRDRARGDRLPVERAVWLWTGAPAAYLGLTDRGELRPGRRADVNVVDLEELSLARPRLVRDLPAGGKRFLQDVTGYRATLCAGQRVLDDGVPTGALPGRVIRMAG